ncbi:protein fantom [Labrus bergylta]|uniref:protein fantom n=1 Tax=Labrus bergylta TaxID=56723 RepID=UPI0033144A22
MMSHVVDETAGDLPVRDVGLMRRVLIPTVQDTHDLKLWKKHHVIKSKDPQRLFRFPREHLEDLCLRLQEENSVLRQHTCTQEQRLRRMSARLMRLQQARPGSSGVKERDKEDTIQELEAHVAMLESQKGVLQNKLSMARQHIMDLRGRTPYKFSKGKNREMDGEVRRAPQTAPPRYGPMLEDTRVEMERFRSSVAEQVRVAELELTAQALRDTLREKEKEIEETVKDTRKQQIERHRSYKRITIREDVDLIRLQKKLSDKSTALRVTEEKLNELQEAYENQLEESQRSLRASQEALLEKVEELAEQLKQARQRALELEGELTTSTLSLQTMDKLKERLSDLEGEKDLIKENYDTLLKRTLADQRNQGDQLEKCSEDDQKRVTEGEQLSSINIQRLEEILQAEREERVKLRLEKDNLRREKERLEEQRELEKEFSVMVKEKSEHLEQEVLHYKEQIYALQNRLDSVTKEFDMSVEELSSILLQIKAFRMQQESRAELGFLLTGHKVEDSLHDVAITQASHAETVLELQKTRNLLLMEHRISEDLQEELTSVNQKMETVREESRRRMAEKDKLLGKQLLQISSLQTQMRDFAYSPKQTMPTQYSWPTGDPEVLQSREDISFSQLRAGESLLEIHLKAATFTPSGLRTMGRIHQGEMNGGGDIVTFCTYSLLDYEMHSTPLVSGCQPSYSFTSRYALTDRDVGRLEDSRVRVELHQALGGVSFLTHGSGQLSLMGTKERRGERMCRSVNITGSEGDIVGVVDFWVCLFNSAEPLNPLRERGAVQRPVQISLGWQGAAYEELYDYGGGIPNELEIMLERCVGLSARWTGLLPDSYLTYRFYDLPPHVSQTIRCTSEPVFNDIASYPLAVTTDVLHYLRSSSLWVYVFDDTEDEMPPSYLAKTPIPLRILASGRDIRGDFVLRDPAGGPRGMVRIMIRWKYPIQPSLDAVLGRQEREDTSQRPIAKPRVKPHFLGPIKTKAAQEETQALPQPQPPLVQQKSSEYRRRESVIPTASGQSRYKKRSTKTSPNIYQGIPNLKPGRKSSEGTSSSMSRRSSTNDARAQDHLSLDEEEEEKEQRESVAAEESDIPESPETSSSQSDIITTAKPKMKKGESLRVEILSLMFEPSSLVVLDKSVQRVYVEYRLLGIPMETTETPMSLCKPLDGKEIHYNFTRVIYVDGSGSAPLRQYLYTMLERTDPNQGRLKFTVVNEPMDDDQECVDVGHAFLDLPELLLTGNDVINQQIDIVGVDEEKEVIGNLKVSLEAAKALTGIYKEFSKIKKEDGTNDEESEEQKREEEQEEEKKRHQIQVMDFDYDSEFY